MEMEKTHEILNHLSKNHLKSNFNITEFEKDEESVRKEKLRSW